MIVPDINLLLDAYNADAPRHVQAKQWWADLLSGDDEVGLAWVVALGFVRLSCSTGAARPVPVLVPVALAVVDQWLARDNVSVLTPGDRHLEILSRLARETGATGRLVTDMHLAALAIEHQAELHSADRDFGRFSGLRWRNPLG